MNAKATETKSDKPAPGSVVLAPVAAGEPTEPTGKVDSFLLLPQCGVHYGPGDLRYEPGDVVEGIDLDSRFAGKFQRATGSRKATGTKVTRNKTKPPEKK